MTPRRSRTLLATCTAVLAALAVAWVAWPDRDGSADLAAVAPIPTTTAPATSSTTTAPSSTTAAPVTTTTVPPVASPSRIRVPSIGLDAAIVPVAIRPDGQMEVPDAADVGWYRLGPQPGAPGSAVLAAHVDFGGRRGAFFDLRQIPIGAEVTIEGLGTTRTFTVSGREQVAKTDVQLDQYFTAEGPARLTLITCGGAFDRGIGHYEDNIIVTATPVT